MATMSVRFIFSKSTVARPVGVRPVTRLPFQAKSVLPIDEREDEIAPRRVKARSFAQRA